MHYLFKHVLLRDVAYNMQLRQQLQRIHWLAATGIEELHAENIAPHYAELAHHYEKAGWGEKAIRYWQLAGDYAKENYALDEARTYYQAALALQSSAASFPLPSAFWAMIYAALGETLRWQARFTEALQAYQNMRQLAEASNDLPLLANAWNHLSETQDVQGNYRLSQESAERAEEIALAASSELELAHAWINKGFALFRMGRLTEALDLGKQVLELTTKLKAKKMIHRSLGLLGGVHDIQGNYQEAASYQRAALTICRQLGDSQRIAVALNNLGENARLCGDYQAAVALYQEALVIARKVGDHPGELAFLSALGGAQAGLQEYELAEITLRRAIQMSQAAEERFSRPYAYLFLAMTLLGQGEIAAASQVAQQALQLGEEINLLEITGGAWRILGQIAMALAAPIIIDNQVYNAPICFATSRRIFTEMGAAGELARTLRAWAKYELRHGNQEQSEKLAAAASEIFARLDMQEKHGG
ncbi:MAG TPA: tetratricopeptide repeat protein [Thermoflexia bacterium]|nr:tetratricopeptide repeat protein [Thermoflexia bacterium]